MVSSYRKPERKDWWRALAFLAIYLAVLGVMSIYLLISYWYVWAALAVAGLVILVSWHAKATAYHCPKCGYDFEISIITDLLSPHGVNKEGGWKYLKCPNCSKRTRTEILVKTKGESNSSPMTARGE
jgi:DNA-directed RNA polymerase subunit RPC12/RpoP